MVFSGLAMGMMAALFLALSYVFSGMSVRRYRSVGTIGLLCRAHLAMGAMSAVGLCFVWSPVVTKGLHLFFWTMLGSVLFYLVGQAGLFMAQKTIDSSRVVPLLGMKLVLLALCNMYLLPLLYSGSGERYSLCQWCGIGMTLLSAFLLNQAGGRIPLSGLGWILLTCSGYALSDTCIKIMLNDMQAAVREVGDTQLMESATRLSLLGAFLSYFMTGIISLFVLKFFPIPAGTSRRGVWGWISPFAFCWLVAMLFLYICFNLIGTVNGNIVQSTRGLIAIIMGWVLSRVGFTELETKITVGVFVRRLIAGVMMVLAIVLFNWR